MVAGFEINVEVDVIVIDELLSKQPLLPVESVLTRKKLKSPELGDSIPPETI